MSLPIRTTVADVQAVCGYLLKKPTGATLREARAVLDTKHLDGRKLTALKFWRLIDEDSERLKLTALGREAVRNDGVKQTEVLGDVIRDVAPYMAVAERAAHRKEESMTAVDVAAHWHEHFPNDVSDSEKTLNDQAVCFFQIASGAGLGTVTIGRRGSPTRIEFNMSALRNFVDGQFVSANDEDESEDELTDKSGEVGGESGGVLGRESAQKDEERLGKGIFIAHGKNKEPLNQLKKILEQFHVPYKVAVDEPNLGRPISEKVRQLLRSCNSAILIFTADEEFNDKDGNTVWRPSENVVHELGASSYLYGDRIVILKEDSVQLPSNFSDLGYIAFGKDQLKAKSMEVLRELIGFGIIKVST